MIVELPIERVKPDPSQPRKTFNQEKINELAQSIKEFGLLQPITVRPPDQTGAHFIIMGERRYRAHLCACLTTIKCVIDYAERNNAEQLAVQLIENLERDDMNPMDTAAGFQRLIESGWQIEDVAHRIGLSCETIQRKINLLNLDGRVQKLVASGQLSESIATPLSRLTKNGQHLALRKIRGKSYADAKPIIDAILCQEQQVDMFAAPDSKREANKLVRSYTMAMLATVSFVRKITSDDYRILANGLDDGRLGKRIAEIDLAIKGLKRVKRELEVYQHYKQHRRGK